jgi:hypothetical protein
MAEEFPLPGSSYKELIKIIQGYGRINGEASLPDVAKMTAMAETTISANNKFLLALGIVKGGKKKTITPIGGELATALEHNLPDVISAKWRVIVDATTFLQNVVAAVRIRKSMDESSLESHIAYSAGQPKTPGVATGARTVVDILEAAGLLKEEGGSLIPLTPEQRPIPETVEKSGSISDSAPTEITVMGSTLRTSRISGGVQLNIDVRVQCTPADLDTLGHKLRKVLKDFNEPEPTPQGAPTQAPQSPPAPPVPPDASDNGVAGE